MSHKNISIILRGGCATRRSISDTTTCNCRQTMTTSFFHSKDIRFASGRKYWYTKCHLLLSSDSFSANLFFTFDWFFFLFPHRILATAPCEKARMGEWERTRANRHRYNALRYWSHGRIRFMFRHKRFIFIASKGSVGEKPRVHCSEITCVLSGEFSNCWMLSGSLLYRNALLAVDCRCLSQCRIPTDFEPLKATFDFNESDWKTSNVNENIRHSVIENWNTHNARQQTWKRKPRVYHSP